MDILGQVITSMNKEDIRFYKLYAARTNTGEERKDLLLFDLMREGHVKKQYDDDRAFVLLYGKQESRNAFYRLKNHLMEEVCKSNFILHVKDDDTIYCYYLLSKYRYYFIRNQYRVALYFLKKAEKQATAANNLEVLDIIYGEFVKLSHEMLSINLEKYLAERKAIFEKLNRLRQIDSILTSITFRLKTGQNYLSGNADVLSILETTINDFLTDAAVRKDPAFKIKIYEAVSQVLLQKHDYRSLEDYLVAAWESFTKEKVFTRNTHHVKLQMLTYLANTYFKNRKHKQSLETAARLKAALDEFNGLHRDKYLFFYYNALVINYSALNPDKAIEILEQLDSNKAIKRESYFQVFINLNLAILWHDKGNFRNALKFLNKLMLLETFPALDTALKIKIAMVELMIRSALPDKDYLEVRIRQIKKEYADILTMPHFDRERKLMEIIRLLIEGKSKIPKKTVTDFLRLKKADSDETELINYNVWVTARTGMN